MGQAPQADEAGLDGLVRGLEVESAQQVGRDPGAVVGRRAPVGKRRVVSCQRLAGGGERGLVPGLAEDRLLGALRPLRRARHAAKGDPDVGNLFRVQPEGEGAHHGRDVLVEALGHLVGTKAQTRLRLGQDDALDELGRFAVLLAVLDEEALQRQLAPLVAAPEHDPGTGRDQGRGAVADRRAVGDVAADGAYVPDLLATEPAEELA